MSTSVPAPYYHVLDRHFNNFHLSKFQSPRLFSFYWYLNFGFKFDKRVKIYPVERILKAEFRHDRVGMQGLPNRDLAASSSNLAFTNSLTTQHQPHGISTSISIVDSGGLNHRPLEGQSPSPPRSDHHGSTPRHGGAHPQCAC
jgi:hypothetical protein